MDKTEVEVSDNLVYMSEEEVQVATNGRFTFALLMSLIFAGLWAGLAVFFFQIASSNTQIILSEIDAIVKGIIYYFPANLAISLTLYSIFNICRLIYFRYLSKTL